MSTPTATARTCPTCEGQRRMPVTYPHTADDGHVWIERRTEPCGTCGGSGLSPQ